eukprot:3599452-Rhodomonas_salina.1
MGSPVLNYRAVVGSVCTIPTVWCYPKYTALGHGATYSLVLTCTMTLRYQVRYPSRVDLGYREGPLSFAPTYKFDPASDTYDSSGMALRVGECSMVALSY